MRCMQKDEAPIIIIRRKMFLFIHQNYLRLCTLDGAISMGAFLSTL